jgi:hypothetical protein
VLSVQLPSPPTGPAGGGEERVRGVAKPVYGMTHLTPHRCATGPSLSPLTGGEGFDRVKVLLVNAAWRLAASVVLHI